MSRLGRSAFPESGPPTSRVARACTPEHRAGPFRSVHPLAFPFRPLRPASGVGARFIAPSSPPARGSCPSRLPSRALFRPGRWPSVHVSTWRHIEFARGTRVHAGTSCGPLPLRPPARFPVPASSPRIRRRGAIHRALVARRARVLSVAVAFPHAVPAGPVAIRACECLETHRVRAWHARARRNIVRAPSAPSTRSLWI
jgi:hypothetical protein